MTGREQRRLYAEVARGLDEILNPGKAGKDRTVGFALLVFPFGDKSGRSHYVSNGAGKRDMAKLFRETARRLDERIAWERAGRGLQ